MWMWSKMKRDGGPSGKMKKFANEMDQDQGVLCCSKVLFLEWENISFGANSITHEVYKYK